MINSTYCWNWEHTSNLVRRRDCGQNCCRYFCCRANRWIGDLWLMRVTVLRVGRSRCCCRCFAMAIPNHCHVSDSRSVVVWTMTHRHCCPCYLYHFHASTSCSRRFASTNQTNSHRYAFFPADDRTWTIVWLYRIAVVVVAQNGDRWRCACDQFHHIGHCRLTTWVPSALLPVSPLQF